MIDGNSQSFTGSSPKNLNPQEAKNASSQGIISPELMVNFVENSIQKHQLDLHSLNTFHANNESLNAEQINHIVGTVKKIIAEQDTKGIGAEILESVSSKLIKNSADLSMISDKNCLFHFFEHQKNIDIKQIIDIYFQDIDSVQIFSQQTKKLTLGANDIIKIHDALNTLKTTLMKQYLYLNHEIDNLYLEILHQSSQNVNNNQSIFEALKLNKNYDYCFDNRFNLTDEQKINLFELHVFETNRDMDKRFSRLGEMDIQPDARQKLIEEYITKNPYFVSLHIDDLGITKINSLARIEMLIKVIKEIGINETYIINKIRFLNFNEQEIYTLAEKMLEFSPLTAPYVMGFLRYLEEGNQIKFCAEHDVSSLIKAYKSQPIATSAREEIEKQFINQIRKDFTVLNISQPVYLESLCREAFMLSETNIQDYLSNLAEEKYFELALILTYLSPNVIIHKFPLFKLDDAKKNIVIEQMVGADPRCIDKIITNLNISEKITVDFLIKTVLDNKLEMFVPQLVQFFKLYESEADRHYRAAALQKISDEIAKNLDKIDLNTEHKISIIKEELKNNEISFSEIMNNVTLSSNEKFILIEYLVDNDIFFTFLSNYSQYVESLILGIDDAQKDTIIKRIAKLDWKVLVSHASRFKVNAQTFIDLSKEKLLPLDSLSVEEILNLVKEHGGLLIAVNIQDLSLTEKQREPIAEALAHENIKDLIPFLNNFNLTNKDLLLQFANQAFLYPQDFLEHLSAFQLEDDAKIFFLEKIASTHPKIAAENLVPLENPVLYQDKLLQIALTIYRQDPLALEQNLPNFNLSNLDKISNFENDRILQLIQNQSLKDLEKIKFSGNATYLEHLAKGLMKKQTDIQGAYWACTFLEQAAYLHQHDGNYKKALELRVFTGTLNLNIEGSALNNFDEKLRKTNILASNTASINFGVTFNWIDSQSIKGQNFRVKDVLIDNQEKRIVDFKVAYWIGDEIRTHLEHLDPDIASKLIGKKITVDDKISLYYPSNNNNYDTSSKEFFEGGPLKVVHIEGLGSLEIGNDLEWGSESNKVKIILDKDSSANALQEALSVLGLTSILIPSTERDLERFKLNSLIHFFYPGFAADNDRDPTYHLKSREEVLERFENTLGGEAADTIRKYQGKITEYEPVPGEKRFCLREFHEEAEMLGARAVMCGVGWNKSFIKSAEQIASIAKMGSISSQERFEAGMIIAGASAKEDFKSNAADSVFDRLTTQSTIDSNASITTNLNLGGNIQIFSHVNTLNYMPYFHRTDVYGVRNPHLQKLKGEYQKRPGATDFIEANQKKWVETNEIMFKKGLNSDAFVLITFQDPRRIFLTEIEQIISSDPSKKDFFQKCVTIDDKLNKIWAEPDQVEALLHQHSDYDASAGTYKTLSIRDHWTVNPKAQIENELRKQDCLGKNIMVQEAYNYSEIALHLEKCNTIKERSERLKNELSNVVGVFKTTGPKFNREKNLGYINYIEKHMKELDTNDLKNLATNREDIFNLCRQCNQHLVSLDFSGQDSLNRELLTSSWNTALHNPKVIMALFALKELENRTNFMDNAIRYVTDGGGGGIYRDIPTCIAKGLEQHAIILEKIPLNINPNGTLPEIFAMERYIERSNIESTLGKVLSSIETAYTDLGGEILTETPILSEFDKPYLPENWKNAYFTLFEKIRGFVEKCDLETEKKLLELQSNYYPDDLRKQVEYGLHLLLEKEGKKSKNLSNTELAQLISNSIYLIEPIVSHAFFDRLHFLAALTCSQTKHFNIATNQGPLPISQLFMEIAKNLQQGVDSKNALAAEQFYIRMLMANETIQKIT